MIRVHEGRYEYLEEINAGVLKQIPLHDNSVEQWVLDIGCGSGTLGEAIRQKGYKVWGIEEDNRAAAVAQNRLDRVTKLDLRNFEAVRQEITGKKFDYLVMSDVLEHLYDPFSTLKFYLQFLRGDGCVVISVPNALVWTNRLSFLFGRFEYADSGVMDRTHIRWFTFSTAKRVVTTAGCKITRVDYTPYLVRAFLPLLRGAIFRNGGSRRIIDSPAYQAYMKYVYPVEYALGSFFKPLTAFRIILVGVLPNGTGRADQANTN
jgi:2-polyprenyl-3-methyl-5-hydroxy-6-metoxy-1,4-benzoquinol methylase